MKNLLFVVWCSLTTVVFAQTETLTKEKITLEFFPKSGLTLVESDGELGHPEIRNSKDMVVIQYNKHHAENPEVSDDEFHESLMFEVPAAWNSFVFRKKIKQSKAIYQMGCFCVERGYYEVQEGVITGKKLSNGNYYITADVSIVFKNGTKKTIKFKGEFKSVHAN